MNFPERLHMLRTDRMLSLSRLPQLSNLSQSFSAIMEHRIPDGSARNKACFRLCDEKERDIPIALVPGNQRLFGREAEKVFLIQPQMPLGEGKSYTLHISRLLQANNYKYLKENHTIRFSAHEILEIQPYRAELCAPHLSLTLEKASLATGEENVALDTSIFLRFSNDICAPAVREKNRSCFRLQTSKNVFEELDVYMAENADPEESKKEVLLRPRKSLTPFTAYFLTISGELTGKNKKSLGIDKILSFTTGGEASLSTPEKIPFSIA